MVDCTLMPAAGAKACVSPPNTATTGIVAASLATAMLAGGSEVAPSQLVVVRVKV